MALDRKGVYIAVLTGGWIRHELAAHLVALTGDRRHRLEMHFSYDVPVSSNRNAIARQFREGDAAYLLMIDHDMVPYHNPLDLVERDLDVVAFPGPLWRPGCLEPPIVLNVTPLDREETKVDIGEGGISQIQWGGTGMMLIARRVLEHPELQVPFAFRCDEDGVRTWAEDADFCEKAREAGFRIWSAMSHPCGHVKEVNLVDVHDAVEEWR